jgi:aminoglycoside phosphotransferase (APT) family kinase protein
MTAPTTAIPATREELLDPEWLAWALDDVGPDDRIVRVERTDSTKTRAEKLRFVVTVESEAGRRVHFYCAKAYLDGSPSGSLMEARFYAELAPRLDMRRPRIHYVAIDAAAGNAMFVMEDVVAGGGLFMNPHRPLPVGVVRGTLSQLAGLHSSTWGLTSISDLDWLPSSTDRFATSYPAPALQELLDDGRADGLPPELRDGELLAAALEVHAQYPVTCVLHGDPHTGNVYLDAQDRGCFFDFETIQTGNWAQDVAYHLASALTIGDRRAHERELVRHYLSELAAGGAPAPDFDEGWELYRRSFTHGYLFWVITKIRGRDEVLAHMPRLAAAIEDHDTYRLLGVA